MNSFRLLFKKNKFEEKNNEINVKIRFVQNISENFKEKSFSLN